MIEHIRYKFFEFTNNFKFKLMDVVFNFMWLKLFESLYVYKKKIRGSYLEYGSLMISFVFLVVTENDLIVLLCH